MRVRDLLVLDGPHDNLVVAADSIGGIGPKPADTVAVPGTTTAHFATRVPLLEVMCVGAEPLAVVNALCVEMDPLGATMLTTVRELAAQAGVPAEAVTGSTEENVATRATGIGVTVVARPGPYGLIAGHARPGDIVLCAGWPRSAPDDALYPGHPDLVDIDELRVVLATGMVHDAVPVGSRGVRWEMSQLAGPAELAVSWEPAGPIPLDQSGGPASCVLLACAPEDEASIRAHFAAALPVTTVGHLRTSSPSSP